MRTPVNLSKRTLRSVAHQGSLIWGKGDLQRDSTLLSSAATWKTLQQALTVFGNRTLVSSVSKSGSLRHPFASNWRYVQQVPLNLRSAGAQQVPAMRTFPSRCLTRTSTTLARQSSTNISIYTRMQLRWQSSMKTSSKSSNLGSIVAMVTAGVVVCTTIFGVYTLGTSIQYCLSFPHIREPYVLSFFMRISLTPVIICLVFNQQDLVLSCICYCKFSPFPIVSHLISIV